MLDNKYNGINLNYYDLGISPLITNGTMDKYPDAWKGYSENILRIFY